ncbi:MAG: hypothetical protein DMD83_03960 [Candidatus Rokuibacteriota bacterium]|nr:MAG: hypothetical protein DMD83_03960 [Candidatus Rokubacteria bacterium]
MSAPRPFASSSPVSRQPPAPALLGMLARSRGRLAARGVDLLRGGRGRRARRRADVRHRPGAHQRRGRQPGGGLPRPAAARVVARTGLRQPAQRAGNDCRDPEPGPRSPVRPVGHGVLDPDHGDRVRGRQRLFVAGRLCRHARAAQGRRGHRPEHHGQPGQSARARRHPQDRPRRPMRKRASADLARGPRGFTLPELLVTAAIFSIIGLGLGTLHLSSTQVMAEGTAAVFVHRQGTQIQQELARHIQRATVLEVDPPGATQSLCHPSSGVNLAPGKSVIYQRSVGTAGSPTDPSTSEF